MSGSQNEADGSPFLFVAHDSQQTDLKAVRQHVMRNAYRRKREQAAQAFRDDKPISIRFANRAGTDKESSKRTGLPERAIQDINLDPISPNEIISTDEPAFVASEDLLLDDFLISPTQQSLHMPHPDSDSLILFGLSTGLDFLRLFNSHLSDVSSLPRLWTELIHESPLVLRAFTLNAAWTSANLCGSLEDECLKDQKLRLVETIRQHAQTMRQIGVTHADVFALGFITFTFQQNGDYISSLEYLRLFNHAILRITELTLDVSYFEKTALWFSIINWSPTSTNPVYDKLEIEKIGGHLRSFASFLEAVALQRCTLDSIVMRRRVFGAEHPLGRLLTADIESRQAPNQYDLARFFTRQSVVAILLFGLWEARSSDVATKTLLERLESEGHRLLKGGMECIFVALWMILEDDMICNTRSASNTLHLLKALKLLPVLDVQQISTAVMIPLLIGEDINSATLNNTTQSLLQPAFLGSTA